MAKSKSSLSKSTDQEKLELLLTEMQHPHPKEAARRLQLEALENVANNRVGFVHDISRVMDKCELPDKLPPIPEPKPNTVTWYDCGENMGQMIDNSERHVPNGPYDDYRDENWYQSTDTPTFKRLVLP